MDERAIFEDLTLFGVRLSDLGLAPKSKSVILVEVKSFISKFYIEFSKMKPETRIKPLEKYKKIPTIVN